MINALRYGFATFLSFSKPLTFLILAGVAFTLVVEIGQAINIQSLSFYQSMVESGAPPKELAGLEMFRPFSTIGVQTGILNALVLLFLSVPVAGQFAQEYRFQTLATTFLIAPRRSAVFVSKTFFALLYVTAAVGIIWLVVTLLGPVLPAPITVGPESTGVFNPAYTVGGDLDWKLASSDWWRVLLYVLGYMLIVISMAIITKSQTLGVLVPVFYLGFVETTAAVSDSINLTKLKTGDWIADEFRFFLQGHAWINQDADYPLAGFIYFGGILVLLGLSFWLFVRRDAKL